MSILTRKMKTARGDYFDSGCKWYFPFNEGSGNDFTDLASGTIITGTNTDHTSAAHGVHFFHAVGSPGTGSVPTVAQGKSVIFGNVQLSDTTGATSNQIIIGDVANGALTLSTNFYITHTSTPLGADFPTLTDAQTCIRIGTWDGVTGLLSAYAGVNGGAVALNDTSDASAYLPLIDGFSDSLLMSNNTQTPEWFCMFMYVVDTLPTDAQMISGGDTIYQGAITGKKILPEEWKGFA